ncbi:MAG: carbohydrate-binding domain-containing protein [Oscillospiraceae bacterium]|nr:carbohydrate-binding domain-containing protein [Oscillospiraceae bacterium]
MKKIFSLLLILALLLSLAACADPVIGEAPADKPLSADPAELPEALIELKGDSVSCKANGVSVKGTTVTIGAPGSYTVRGTLSDGRIVVDLKENPGKVSLYLDGADIRCLTDSAIYLAQAKELNLVLVAGSKNTVTSGTTADFDTYDETRQGAAIFAEDDLDIQGEGELEVFGYLNNGITCKDDLKIKGGSLTVTGANNGVRASESVTVTGGSLVVTARNDGVKASSAKKADKGFVQIEGGTVQVLAGGDGISAETELRISGGAVTVETNGDPAEKSCKGLKGKTGVVISGGTISVAAQDHAVRSVAALTVSGGELTAESAQGKGLAAETELLIEAGTVSVTASDDGLASADTVRIAGGELNVVSGADGIQGGKKGTGFTAEVGTVVFEGGVTRISAFNKPIDAKAVLRIGGGTVFACGSGTLRPESELPYLLYTAEGHAGDELTLNVGAEHALHAAYLYHTVFFVGEGLSEGQSVRLQAGSQSLEAKAAR